MAKVADVLFGWTKSPSADVSKLIVTVTNDGVETKTEVGPEVQEMQVAISANTSTQIQIVVEDSEGRTSSSSIYSITLGDLENPLPVSNIFHEILGVREV